MNSNVEDSFSPILIAVLLIFTTIVLFILRRLLKSSKGFVLLTGLNDTGKTLIHSQLLHNQHVLNYTSSQDNVEECNIDGKKITVVDLPGFHSIRQQFFEKYKENSKGIVYVVDSTSLAKNIRDAANVLNNILSEPVVLKKRPNILILCNKQDQTLAKGASVIKTMLEKELNTLRNSELNQLKQLDSKETSKNRSGDSSKEFTFASLNCKVEFAESFAFNKNNSVDLDSLKKWIRKVAT